MFGDKRGGLATLIVADTATNVLVKIVGLQKDWHSTKFASQENTFRSFFQNAIVEER